MSPALTFRLLNYRLFEILLEEGDLMHKIDYLNNAYEVKSVDDYIKQINEMYQKEDNRGKKARGEHSSLINQNYVFPKYYKL